jgi:poly-gamma-glutamate system protein
MQRYVAGPLERLQWLLTRTGTRLSNWTLVLLGVCGLLAVALVLGLQLRGSGYGRKVDAATAMRDDEAFLRSVRVQRELPINEDDDPNGTGLIGQFTSPITTDRGSLRQKLTSTNPNIAAAIVDLLDQARIKRGDVVAVGLTGSFPALGLAVLEALERRGAVVLEIASVGASNWGANEPKFTWLDMQQALVDAGRLHPHVIGASAGGSDDNGKSMTARGRDEALAAITRNGVSPIRADSVQAAAEERLRRYDQHASAQGRRVKLYINIGGGVSSVGPAIQKNQLRTGVNSHLPSGAENSIGVAYEFLRRGTPVIQLRDVQVLARHYGLPEAPTPFPRIGIGPAYRDRGLQTTLAALGLAELAILVALARKGMFERLWRALGRRRSGRAVSPAQPG